jgi:RimJ/RimL family protein N-acetyltransferase
VSVWDWQRAPAPVRIETSRLVIRRFEVDDAAEVKRVIDANVQHLRPFMVWAFDEPQSLEQKIRLVEQFRTSFDAGRDFTYGVFDREDGEYIGGCGLHPRVGFGGLEIGYWVRADRTREGIATELTAALTRVAIEVCGADRVEIRIDPANEPSLGVPPKVGYGEEVRLKRRIPGPPGEPPRDAVVFTLFADELPRSPAAALELAAFDADGERLL